MHKSTFSKPSLYTFPFIKSRKCPFQLCSLFFFSLLLISFLQLHTVVFDYHLINTTTPLLPSCGRAILFSGARQGSTWFIDSIEHCAYSSPQDREFHWNKYVPHVFKSTELWKHFGEHMDKHDALEYIVSNSSVKIFPSVFWKRRNDLRYLLNQAKSLGIHVFVLRRDVEHTWKSWSIAQVHEVWNGVKVNATGKELDKYEQQYNYFKDSRKRYDDAVDRMLKEEHVTYDLFEFDKVKDQHIIIASNNGCVIRNCNFAPKGKAMQ